MCLTVHEQQVFLAHGFGLNELEILLQNLVRTVESPFRRCWVLAIDIEVLFVENDLQFDSAPPKSEFSSMFYEKWVR
jgi:hypothetical protein